jgi:hypothetical protein
MSFMLRTAQIERGLRNSQIPNFQPLPPPGTPSVSIVITENGRIQPWVGYRPNGELNRSSPHFG